MTDPRPEVRVDTAEESKTIPARQEFNDRGYTRCAVCQEFVHRDHVRGNPGRLTCGSECQARATTEAKAIPPASTIPKAGVFNAAGATLCSACLGCLMRSEAMAAPGGWVCGPTCLEAHLNMRQAKAERAAQDQAIEEAREVMPSVLAEDMGVSPAELEEGHPAQWARVPDQDTQDAEDAARMDRIHRAEDRRTQASPDAMGWAEHCDAEDTKEEAAAMLACTSRPAGTAGFPQDDAAVVRVSSVAGMAQGLAPMPPPDEPLRLEIGGGLRTPEGWICVDRSADPPMEAWPLPYADGTVDAINASHVLEHFPHRLVATVLADWIRALRPGGLLRVSVPDMTRVAKLIAAGEPCIAPDGREVSWAHILAGGQKDLNDYHLSHMDVADLMTLMARGGLIGVGEFASDRPDCSQYSISANVQGRKPSAEMMERATSDRVSGCRTIPRLGWNRTAERMTETALRSGVEFTSTTGAYVDLGFERAILQAMKAGRDFILVTDYDTVWQPGTIQTLVMLMDIHPEYDAMMAMQLRRGTQEILASADEAHTQDSFAAEVVQVKTGHFGCTIFRREVFEKLELPWFRHQDSVEEGGVRKTVEADMAFWRKFGEAGLKFGAATHVPVGHTEEFIVWPDQQLRPLYQPDLEYDDKGPPPGVRT